MAGTSEVMCIDVGTVWSMCEEWATLREGMMSVLAALACWPFARCAMLLRNLRADVGSFLLNFHPNSSSHMMMRMDGRNRFRSRLEHRLTRVEIGPVTREGSGRETRRLPGEEPLRVAYGRRAPA